MLLIFQTTRALPASATTVISMMKRDAALRILAKHIPDQIVVAVYQMAFDWMHIRPHPLNYLCTGAMGQASSHGLGLALAAPDEKIFVLDGDGSLLMNLGSLITASNLSLPNFYHFVGQNNSYEVNGEFPIPGADKLCFAGLAREAGYKHAFTFADTDDFNSEIKNVIALTGPVFVCLQIEAGEKFERDYQTIHSAQTRNTFRQAFQSRLGINE